VFGTALILAGYCLGPGFVRILRIAFKITLVGEDLGTRFDCREGAEEEMTKIAKL